MNSAFFAPRTAPVKCTPPSAPVVEPDTAPAADVPFDSERGSPVPERSLKRRVILDEDSDADGPAPAVVASPVELPAVPAAAAVAGAVVEHAVIDQAAASESAADEVAVPAADDTHVPTPVGASKPSKAATAGAEPAASAKWKAGERCIRCLVVLLFCSCSWFLFKVSDCLTAGCRTQRS